MKHYDFDRVEELAKKPWPKFRIETDLIPKALVRHMQRGVKFYN